MNIICDYVLIAFLICNYCEYLCDMCQLLCQKFLLKFIGCRFFLFSYSAVDYTFTVCLLRSLTCLHRLVFNIVVKVCKKFFFAIYLQ